MLPKTLTNFTTLTPWGCGQIAEEIPSHYRPDRIERISTSFLPEHGLFAVGCDDGNLELWSKDLSTIVGYLEGLGDHGQGVLSAVMDQEILTILNGKGEILQASLTDELKTIQPFQIQQDFTFPIYSGCISPCGNYALASDTNFDHWFLNLVIPNSRPVLLRKGETDMVITNATRCYGNLQFTPKSDRFLICDDLGVSIGYCSAPHKIKTLDLPNQYYPVDAIFLGDHSVIASAYDREKSINYLQKKSYLYRISLETGKIDRSVETSQNKDFPVGVATALAATPDNQNIIALSGLKGPFIISSELQFISQKTRLIEEITGRSGFLISVTNEKAILTSRSGLTEIDFTSRNPQKTSFFKGSYSIFPDYSFMILKAWTDDSQKNQLQIALLPRDQTQNNDPAYHFTMDIDHPKGPWVLSELSGTAYTEKKALIRDRTSPEQGFGFFHEEENDNHYFRPFDLTSGTIFDIRIPSSRYNFSCVYVRQSNRLFALTENNIYELCPKTAQIINEVKAPLSSFFLETSVSQDGRFLAIVTGKYWLVYDLAYGIDLIQLQANIVRTNHFSCLIHGQGKKISIGSAFDIIATYDIETGQLLTVQKHLILRFLYESPNGEELLGFSDGQLSHWGPGFDPETHQTIKLAFKGAEYGDKSIIKLGNKIIIGKEDVIEVIDFDNLENSLSLDLIAEGEIRLRSNQKNQSD